VSGRARPRRCRARRDEAVGAEEVACRHGPETGGARGRGPLECGRREPSATDSSGHHGGNEKQKQSRGLRCPGDAQVYPEALRIDGESRRGGWSPESLNLCQRPEAETRTVTLICSLPRRFLAPGARGGRSGSSGASKTAWGGLVWRGDDDELAVVFGVHREVEKEGKEGDGGRREGREEGG
jgi:hypothetical protein